MPQINIDDTRTLLKAIEENYKPSGLLVNTFFPKKQTFVTEVVDIEYYKSGRKMAPFVVPGTKGVNMGREGSTIRTYKAPVIRPRRIIEATDLMQRGFGEDIYSKKTGAQRAAELRARDIKELCDQIDRRKEWMAAQLLINSKYNIEGFADDGKTKVVDCIEFTDWNGKTTLSGSDTWDNASAKILDNLGDISHDIRRNAQAVPTIAICSENVSRYILNNQKLRDIMMIPSRENMSMVGFAPRIQSPEIIRVGMIASLNMEIYTYDGCYTDDNGALQQYIPDDHIIIGVPGRGQQLFGAVTQIEDDKAFHTYASEYVPKVTVDIESDTAAVAVSSRPVLAPMFIDDWATIKVK